MLMNVFPPSQRVLARAALLVIGLCVLAACETGPTYKPKGPGESVGYSDKQLSQNRYRVSFTGRNITPREEVEEFLLRRAAEVTLAAGFTHFVFDTRNTEAKTYYRTTFDAWAEWGPPYYPGYGGWYWSSWPFSPQPIINDTTPITHYTAYAEIRMLKADEAAKTPEAFSAADVLAHLAPQPAPKPQG
jgi:hypothetical protein